MAKKRVPTRLWDFRAIYEAEILLLMVRGSNGRTSYKEVTGEMPEIGEWPASLGVSQGAGRGSPLPRCQVP